MTLAWINDGVVRCASDLCEDLCRESHGCVQVIVITPEELNEIIKAAAEKS